MRNNIKTGVILLLLASFVILLRLPSLSEPLDNDSGANAYLARLIMRGEPLYSTNHTGHHLPGVYYSYILAFWLFGDQQFAPKWLLLPWTIVIAWLLYFLGRRVSGELAGALSGVFFVLGTAQLMLKGMTAETELFANLPITAAVVLAFFLLNRPSHTWLWLWVGALSSVAIIYKIIYLAPLASAGFALLGMAWAERRQPGARSKLFARLVYLGAGFIIPLLAMLAYFASQGLLGRFWLVFQYGFTYMREFSTHVSPLPLPPLVGFPVFLLALNNFSLLVFGLAGALRLGRQVPPMDSSQAASRLGLLVWLLVSFIQAGVNTVGFAHYVLIVIPPLACFAGIEIASLRSLWRERLGGRRSIILTFFLVSLVLLNSILTNYQIYAHDFAYRLGWETYEQSLARRPGTGQIYLRVRQVADYINSHTAPDAQVYYWGVDAQFYYLADRRCALDIVWPYYVDVTHSRDRIFDPRTEYIIVSNDQNMLRPDWLVDGLSQGYYLERVIDGEEIYHRVSNPAIP